MSNKSPIKTLPTEKAAAPDTAAFEIRDPDIASTDVAAIMQGIRERIRERTETASANGQRYDLPAAAAELDRAAHLQTAGMHQAIDRLRSAASGVTVQLSVVQKRPLPIIGPVLARLRGGVHQLVLYDVQALAARQTVFNRASMDAVQQLAVELAQARKRIDQLEQENQALQAHPPLGESGPSQ